MRDSLIYRCRLTPGWMPVLDSEDRLSANRGILFANRESHLYNKTGRSVYMLPLRVW